MNFRDFVTFVLPTGCSSAHCRFSGFFVHFQSFSKVADIFLVSEQKKMLNDQGLELNAVISKISTQG